MSPGPSTFVHCGVRLRSALDLPLVRTCGDPEVELTWGPSIPDSDVMPPGSVIAEGADATRRLFTATDAGSEFLVRFPGCGEFAISDTLDEVEVRPDREGRNTPLLPVLMTGAVAAILHELRGSTILHASAVAVDRTAIAFPGRSGQGKSTIAAWMCANGAELVTDDVLLVESSPEPSCTGAASELRLRAAATGMARAEQYFDARTTADGRTALAPTTVITEPVPLGAIVFPVPAREASELELVEVPPMSQLLSLLNYPRIDGWRRDDVLARRFDTLGALVGALPMYAARIPWRMPFAPSVAPALMDLVR